MLGEQLEAELHGVDVGPARAISSMNHSTTNLLKPEPIARQAASGTPRMLAQVLDGQVVDGVEVLGALSA